MPVTTTCTRCVAVTVAAIAVSAAVHGDDRPLLPTDLTPPAALRPAPAEGGVAGAGLFEDFEDPFFVCGQPAGPNSWFTPAFGGNWFIDCWNPIQGNKSAVHVSDGTSIGGFEMDSPDFGPNYGTISALVKITGSDSLYQFVLLDGGNFYFITRINFETDGRITIGQTNPDPEIDGFEFFFTGFTWEVDELMRICVVNEPNGALTVFKNGDLMLAGMSAAKVSFDEGDAADPPGGIGRFMTFTDNVGQGDLIDPCGEPFPCPRPLGTGDNFYVDDFRQECQVPGPCPGNANDDFDVDIDDIIRIIFDFGGDGSTFGGDVDGSGLVDIDDVIFCVLNFGPCPVL